jgi:hypothetical protein
MIRDDKKVLLLQNQQPIKPIIYIYSSAGKLLEQIQVKYHWLSFGQEWILSCLQL